MSPILKFSAIAIKVSSGVVLAADAVSSSRPLIGLIVSAISLIPIAMALQDILGPDQRLAQLCDDRASESAADVVGA
jgi:hypothetical protein